MKMRLRQRRTIVPASLSRLFAPLLQFEKWEIHTVFLHFSNFEVGQKSWLSLLVKLCGVALKQTCFDLTFSICPLILVFNKTVKNRFIRLLFQQPAAQPQKT